MKIEILTPTQASKLIDEKIQIWREHFDYQMKYLRNQIADLEGIIKKLMEAKEDDD